MTTCKLKTLLKIKNGCDHKALNDGCYPVYGSGGIMRYVDSYLYDKPSILLPRKGTLDNIQYVDSPFWTVDTTYYTEVDTNKVDVYFLYNYLKLLDLSKLNTGTGVPSMTFDSYYDLNINLPDLPIQKKIADVLSCIDDKIALNNKTNSELENMAKTVYDYWFTQFDFPVSTGSTTGETKPYKSSGGKMEYNEVLKREIPAGWKNGCFGDLIEIGNGKDHSKLSDGDIPVYGSGGLMRNVEKSLYEGESVLFPRKGTLNNVMYVNEKFWTVDTMFYSIPKSEHIPLYVFYNAKHFDFEKMNTGTGVPSMTSSIIKELPIVIPNMKVLENFDNKVQPIYKQIFRNQKENEELTKLRDYLLPLLMNGQIEVK